MTLHSPHPAPSDGPPPSPPNPAPLLTVDGLRVSFPRRDGEGGRVQVVKDLSFDLHRGEIVGLVGESGSGKSLTALSLMRLVPPPGSLDAGTLRIDGQKIGELKGTRLRQLRGGRIGMIFQEPSSALNPVLSIGYQIIEAIRAHRPLSRRQAREEAARLLELVALPEPRRRLRSYPHQLSGGQRQRVMIAIALAGQPDLLVADEPTTALDVTIQAQILDLLQQLREDLGLAVLLITHDLAVVAETCDRVMVMYNGELVEKASVETLFAKPQHSHTRALLAALPRLGSGKTGGAEVAEDAGPSPLLSVRGLEKRFELSSGWLQSRSEVRAVDGVDLDIHRGECLALVGESGSGKTTFGRCVTRLLQPNAGTVRFDGEDLLALSGSKLRRKRKRFQMIFQDPYSSLNPRMRVGAILEEPLAVHRLVPRSQRPERVTELLEQVGLPADAARRYPHEFSGGQRQRVVIARALATEPDLIIADEPVSALDVSVRAQIIQLLSELRQELGLTLLFITHDLALVEQIADRVAVLYLGKLVELAPARQLFAEPEHPYTVSLLEAVPRVDPGRRRRQSSAPEGRPGTPSAADSPGS
ncbi:MAG: ABC transporter ATP-binding protein [Acidobacteriota bacterium]